MIINPYVFGGAATDPSFANVTALLHFDGTNGSTTVTDVKGHTWTAGGGAALSTAQQKFGTASGLASGSGQVFTATSSTDYNFGTGDFTIEFQFRPTAVALKNFFDMRPILTATAVSPVIYMYADGKVAYYVNGSELILSATGIMVQDVWHAMAYSRASGTGRLFVNGAVVGSSITDSSDYSTPGNWSVFLPTWGTAFATGYWDELRITKGVGRYTGTYTPQSAAFPDS